MKREPTDAAGCCEPRDLQAMFPGDLPERAKLFRALGEEVRLRLLYLVRDDEVCVCDLVATFQMPQGTLSHHLGVLQQAGLVTSRRQGRWNYYRATSAALEALGWVKVALHG